MSYRLKALVRVGTRRGPLVPGRNYGVPEELRLSEAESLVRAGVAEWIDGPEEGSLEDLSKPELEELANERGVDVERTDGKPGPLRKSDYVAAL